MKTQEALLVGGLSGGVGAVLGYLLTPSVAPRALYATGDSVQADRVKRILDTQGISSVITAPSLDPATVRLVGQNTTTLYVVLVSQSDFEKAFAALPK